MRGLIQVCTHCGAKLCTQCGESKPVEEFYRHPLTRDGRMHQCKSCKKAYQLESDRRKAQLKKARRERTPA